MRVRTFTSLALIAAIVAAGCGSDDKKTESTSAATTATTAAGAATTAAGAATTAAGAATTTGDGGGGCTVGVSWNNYQEERWAKWDEPAIKAAIEAGGGTYISNDAKSSAETQASNVENLISQGANVLIVLAQDGTAIKPSVASAIAERRPGHRLRPPHRGSQGCCTSRSTTSRSGSMQAEADLRRGAEGQLRHHQGQQGRRQRRLPARRHGGGHRRRGEAGDIKIVGETYTDNWDPAKAQTEMEQFLTATTTRSTPCSSENDGMAGGVVAALEAQGLAGKVPVSGQDGDQAALNRVALGTQTVDVWKDARAARQGRRRGRRPALQRTPTSTKVAGTQPFTTPGGNNVTSILLTRTRSRRTTSTSCSTPAGSTKATLCQGVDGRHRRGLRLTVHVDQHVATCALRRDVAREGHVAVGHADDGDERRDDD